MVVERGHEHDERHDVRCQRLDDLESPEPRHFDIEEHHLWPVFADGLERREAIVRIAVDQLETARREQLAQPRSGRSFIVRDQSANGHAGVSLS
jgi:hypothetical protein